MKEITMPQNHSLMNITVPEVTELLERNPVAIIPTGSVEQHGSHLPFGTDYFASYLFAERLAEAIDALLLPFTPLGVTPIHMSFTGTISLSPETYMGMLTDVCQSIIQHGAKRIIIVNWHELNQPLIDTVAGRLQQEYPVRFIVVQAHFVALELYRHESDLTHGGLLEALPVLAYDPSLAKLERGVDPSPHGRGNQVDRLRRRRETYMVVNDVRDMYPTGWYGTLEGATVEKAQEFVEAVTAKIVEYVTEVLEAMQTNPQESLA